jgi:hypothetical protein
MRFTVETKKVSARGLQSMSKGQIFHAIFAAAAGRQEREATVAL